MKKFIYILILIFSFTTLPKANATWERTDKLIGTALFIAVGSAGIIVLNELMQKKMNNYTKKFSPREMLKFIKENQFARSFLEDELRYRMSSEKNEKKYIFMQKAADFFNVSDVPPFMPENSSKYNPEGIEGHNENIDNKLENPISDIHFPYILENPKTGERVDTRLEFPMETPKNWEEYLLLKKDSQILADKMIEAGISKPKNSAAHHVIPITMKAAKDARNRAIDYGIDLNGVMNGIWLPDPSESDAIGLIHSGRHPNIYAEAVNERIMALDVSKSDYENSQKKIINEINNIKEKLYNAQKDGKTWYDVL